MATAPAPRGTRAVIAAVLAALDRLPAEQRKLAFRHVAEAVKERLAKDAARAKAGKPPRVPAARGKSAPAPARLASAQPAAVRRARSKPDAGEATGPARGATGQRTVPASELQVPRHAETRRAAPPRGRRAQASVAVEPASEVTAVPGSADEAS